jgi:hypothetical protein
MTENDQKLHIKCAFLYQEGHEQSLYIAYVNIICGIPEKRWHVIKIRRVIITLVISLCTYF